MSNQTNGETSNFVHNIYRNDPLCYKSYVNKKVTITLEDSNTHTGIVYTVDPVSESIVLMQPEEGEEKMKMKIIMKPAIKALHCFHDTEVPLPEMFVAPPLHYNEEEITKRKNLVKKSLLDNRIPVTEENGVLCFEDARIEPPYKSQNCHCLNSTMLRRMQAILARIPN